MEDRYERASRLLTALATMMLPLTLLAMATWTWYVNYANYQFNTNKWTSYLLLACWIFFLLAVIAGISSLINPPAPEIGLEAASASGEPKEAAGEEKNGEEPGIGPAKKPRINLGYALLLAQSASFVLGLLLFFVYVAWLLLGLDPLPQQTTGAGF